MISIFRKENLDKPLLIRLAVSLVLLLAAVLLQLSFWAELALLIAAWLIAGYEVAIEAVKGIFKGGFLDENFLMLIASAGAFLIDKGAEGVAVILLYQLGEMLSDMAVDSSRDSITELMDLRPDTAHIEDENGGIITVHPDQVAVGGEFIVYPGEKLPLDGVVISGESDIDASAMTGESAPVAVEAGSEVLSGCINGQGTIRVKATRAFDMSAAARVLELVTDIEDKKAPSERFITSFAKVYTPIVVGCAVLLAALPPLLFNGDFSDWLYRALTFLVISCPCALVISVPLGFFAGIGCCAKQGILVKGGSAMEDIARARNVVFDKTGTLTNGSFTVSNIVCEAGVSERELIMCAAEAERLSRHPLALSLKDIIKDEDIPEYPIEAYTERPGKGAVLDTGDTVIAAGNAKLMRELGAEAVDTDKTCVHVIRGGKYLGRIEFKDSVRDEAKRAMPALRERGAVGLYMLTGDAEAPAKDVAQELTLSGYRARLSPVDKVSELEALHPMDGALLYLGDGTNDAPVLAAADVGFAMGLGGTDSAIEAADVVLLSDDPYSVVLAIDASRKTMSIVRQNIIFAIGVKLVILALGALGIANLWLAVFADVGVALLAVLNSLRALYPDKG